jgi:hypothetical protein
VRYRWWKRGEGKTTLERCPASGIVREEKSR